MFAVILINYATFRKYKEKITLFFLYFAQLAVILHKLHCGSEKLKYIWFFAHLAVILQNISE